MAIEIERKFLVANNTWKTPGLTGEIFRQSYLNTHPERTVRVRIVGDIACICIKSKTYGISRQEFEYDIPVSDANQLLDICEATPIEKTRYRVLCEGHTWEIDEFWGSNQGLVIAEIELSSEKEDFARPDWLGQEVSNDKRYFNSQLSINPYKNWQNS